MKKRIYTEFDFNHLAETYFRNPWLAHRTNHEGFEDMWFDYKRKEEKLILKKLINSFKYLSNEEAEEQLYDHFIPWCIDKDFQPNDTLFVGIRKHLYADGSSGFLQFMKGPLITTRQDWVDHNQISYYHHGKKYLRKGGLGKLGVKLKHLVLVDDFVGTGRTAYKQIMEVKKIIEEEKKEVNLYFVALAGMLAGRLKVKKTGVPILFCNTLRKGTTIVYEFAEREKMRHKIQKMERILAEVSGEMDLKTHSLGHGKSEALFSWNRLNIPNNVYPLFWWNRYSDQSFRKSMFNRMQ